MHGIFSDPPYPKDATLLQQNEYCSDAFLASLVVQNLLNSRRLQNAKCDLVAFIYNRALFPFQHILNAKFSCCSHMIHRSCMENLMQTSNHTTGNTFFCPVCRRMENASLSVYVPSLINREWRRRLFGDTLFDPASRSPSPWAKLASLENRIPSVSEFVETQIDCDCRKTGCIWRTPPRFSSKRWSSIRRCAISSPARAFSIQAKTSM